jgi:hypothetical protein
MYKVAVIVLADTETHEGLGRIVNALEVAKEFKAAGDDIKIIFDGAGTKWVPELSKPDHKVHGLYAAVREKVAGVCGYCAGAFGAAQGVESAGAPFVRDFDGHPSFRKLVADGYQLIIL